MSLKRKIDYFDDEIIRSRLLVEGDQGSDDRRVSTLIKTFHKSPFDIEKLRSLLYSIEHSYRLLKLTLQMDEQEQSCYAIKSEHLHQRIQQLREELRHNEERLIQAKRRRLNLLEYDQRTERINKLHTRKELRIQQGSIAERKRYFEHLQQTFETSYQQRLKQIAIYMRPMFEFEEILQQDVQEDEQPTPTIKLERLRTYSDSSIASLDENQFRMTLFTNHHPQPLFSNELELYGTQLVNPLLICSSSLHR